MARATLELPGMIAALLGGRRRIEVEGATLQAALADAFAREPRLRVHVLQESGRLREHVLCFVNGENARWHPDEDLPLEDGDRITIVQAVSGG